MLRFVRQYLSLAAAASAMVLWVLPVAADTDGPWGPAYGPAVTTNRAMAYVLGDDILLAGGLGVNDAYTDETWRLDLGAPADWSELGNPGTAAHFVALTGGYDAVRDRMMVLEQSKTRLWVRSVGSPSGWTALTTTGSTGGSTTAAAYDAAGDRLLLIANGVTYQLSLSTLQWTLLATTGAPSARFNASLIVDPVRNRAVLFGGAQGFTLNVQLNEVWQLSLDNLQWSQTIVPGTLPPDRASHRALYDPIGDRMMVIGGGNTANPPLADFWSLSLASPAWTPLPSNPFGGVTPLIAYDAARSGLVAVTNTGSFEYPLAAPGPWTNIAPSGAPPSPRSGHSAVYDPLRNQVIVFGGQSATGTALFNDVWILHLDHVRHWEAVTPAGTPPSARYLHSAVWDASTRRMIVFGGFDGAYRNDAWALDLSDTPTWVPLSPAGTPPAARAIHSAVWLPGSRMRVFGGEVAGPGALNDTWDLDLSGSPQWNAVATTGTPPAARTWHSAIYDPPNARTIVYAGRDAAYAPLGDTWALSDAGAWTALTPAGSPPRARFGHAAVVDPIQRRMIVVSGTATGVPAPVQNDSWSLSLDGPPVWSSIAAGGDYGGTNFRGHSAVYGAIDRQVIVFGSSLGPAYQLPLAHLLGVPGPGGVAHGLSLAIGPQPCTGDAWARFSLPAEGRARMELIDTQGRRRATLFDATASAGPHEIRWSPRGHAIEAGVYWLVLAQGGARTAGRLVILP